nr:unnamed protein product [Digitaria exilis]
MMCQVSANVASSSTLDANGVNVEHLAMDLKLFELKARETISEYGLAYTLKVTGVGLAGESTIALCFYYYSTTMLVVARPGDARWTVVESNRWFYTAMSFQGRFYCVSCADDGNGSGKGVMALDLDVATPNKPPRLVVAAKLTCRLSSLRLDTVHLVESDGSLLLLRSELSFRKELGCHIRRYEVFAVDLAAKKTVPVRALGRRAVFLGETRALSVSPLVFPSIHPDRVYPAADLREKKHHGVGSYSLLNGSIERCKVRMGTATNGDDEFDGGWERPCGIVDYLSWKPRGAAYVMEAEAVPEAVKKTATAISKAFSSSSGAFETAVMPLGMILVQVFTMSTLLICKLALNAGMRPFVFLVYRNLIAAAAIAAHGRGTPG